MKEDKFKLRKRIQEDYGKDNVLLTIGIEPDEVDQDFIREMMKRHWDAGFGDRKEFIEKMRTEDPEFYEKIINNTPYQRAYLFGFFWHSHPDPQAYLESMFVKKKYRNRGYATEMMTEILKGVDEVCYPTYGKVISNEKVDDFTWDFGGGKSLTREYDYGIDLSVEEYNERQEKLVNFYKRFDFEVIEKHTEPDGRKGFIIKRPNQCEL